MEPNLGVTGAKRSSYRQHNPRNIIAKIMEERPTAGLREVQQMFRQRLHDDPDYDEYRTTLEDYFSANAYESLLDEKRKKRKRQERTTRTGRTTIEAQAATATAKINKKIEEKATILFLEMTLPNGKQLRQSTGADCRRAGGWFALIAKRVGDRQLVGKVLSEGQLQEMWQQRK